MADKKPDLRTLKTKKAIFEALAELMCEKELRQITIKELSDKAEIHRVTVYKHFVDIYDVYRQFETMVLLQLGELITEYGSKTIFEVYPVVFKYITENPVIFKMIFSPHNTSGMYQKLLKMVEGLNRLIWAENLGVDMNDRRVKSAIRYHSNGTLAIVANWVLNDFDLPQTYIIQTLSGLDKTTQAHLKEQMNK